MENLSRRSLLGLLGTALGGVTLRQNSDADARLFGARLAGSNEVPPVETDAFGAAVFRADAAEERIDYWLFVANAENVTKSHVHKGPPDLNGNVVAYLFGPAERPVTTTGLLSSGTLTDDDVIWPLTDAAELVAQMRAANVYVNVHTTAHPPGEIRGQIRPIDA